MTIGAQEGEIAEVGSPVQVEPAPVDREAPRRWASITIAVAAAFLALFNADAVRGWFDELSPTALSEALRAPVTAWSDATAPLDGARRALRRGWQRAQAARFGAEQPGERGSDAAP